MQDPTRFGNQTLHYKLHPFHESELQCSTGSKMAIKYKFEISRKIQQGPKLWDRNPKYSTQLGRLAPRKWVVSGEQNLNNLDQNRLI